MGRRHSQEQIIGILKESELGAKTGELCRTHGISTATFYKWEDKYGGMSVNEARRLKQLEIENTRLKTIVANRALDIQVLKAINENSKNF